MVLHRLKKSPPRVAGPHVFMERLSITPESVAGTTENAAKPPESHPEGKDPSVPSKTNSKAHISRTSFGYRNTF